MKSKSDETTTPNWENRTLFLGDNLKVMRAMNSETIDLICTDPPFNKGKDFHATPDSLSAGSSFQDRWSWRDDVDQEWLDQITDDFPLLMNVIQGSRSSYGDDMGAYLAFMAVRLLAMKRLLKPTGSIYLHCDPTASHYLKELMDAIFGKENFLNEIIWAYNSGGGTKKRFGRKHDVILFYSKTKDYFFNADAVRVPYDATIAKSREHLFNDNGKVMPDVWNISRPPNHSKEWLGYPTQKPLKVYETMILASSKPGDIVLDPFCGCATTLVAAEKLQRRWVGIDIWTQAHEAVRTRLEAQALVQAGSGESPTLFDDGEFLLVKDVPERTDDGETAAPFLRVKQKVREPEYGKRMSRSEMYDVLLSQDGPVCRGCDRRFDDPRYLELDHNTPRSDGGINHVSNRILLCSPCNRAKSNTHTLSGLRKLNKQNGWMAPEK
jgi:site-specific DNA-methyltransferase (adenine-specific)